MLTKGRSPGEGWLIALQVNNWNEGRKAHNRLKVHFSELKDETEMNLRTRDALLQRFNAIYSQATVYTHLTGRQVQSASGRYMNSNHINVKI